MPFMRGTDPVRRTLKYLNAGLKLQPFIRSVIFGVTSKGSRGTGIRNFLYWHINQLQYRNPDVQFTILRDKTPIPYIQCILSNSKEVVVDCDNRSKEEILNHLHKTFASHQQQYFRVKNHRDHALFGDKFLRHCMCEVPTQVPCPSVVKLPKSMRGKYTQAGEE